MSDNKKTIKSMKVFEISKVLRFFIDELSNDKCAVILSKEGEEICVTADIAADWLVRQQVIKNN
jgi:hypothetical protein|tara:strand:- start:275 stop:466 length:192 start_codon:yes stop_codon:yes gene_type:complete